MLAKIKRKEVEIIRTLVDSEIKLIDLKLRPLAATQQRFGAVQTAITVSDKKTTKEKLKLEQEKERLQALLETLQAGELKKRFFWEIDFAEIFADGGFDIVIANPPYVRQEKIAPLDIPEEEITKELKKDYKDALVRSVTAQWKDEFKKNLKSDVYVYFYYHGLSLLKPGGVFCFISSNSWLDVGFGANLQEFLLRNIEVKAIYDNHAKRSFEEASINTIIAIFKRPDDTSLAEKLTKFVAFKKPFETVITEEHLKALANAKEKVKTDDYRCIPLTQGELWKEGLEEEGHTQSEITGTGFIGQYVGNKWGGKYLRAPDIFFTILEKGKGKLVRLGDIAEVRRGFTTGANDWFFIKILEYLDNGTVRIQSDDLERTEHLLERCFVNNKIVTKTKELINPIIDTNNLAYSLVLVDNQDTKTHPYLSRYINWGESIPREYHKRPTCSQRARSSNWFRIKHRESANILLPIGHKRRAVIGINNGALAGDNLVEVRLFEPEFTLTYAASMYSTFYPINLEILGRANFGQGLLKTQTFELKKILVINPKALDRNCRRKLEKAFLKLSKRPSLIIYDDVRCQDRYDLDDAFLEAIGFTDETERLELINELHNAACRMIWNRMAKTENSRETLMEYDAWKALKKPFSLELINDEDEKIEN